MHVSSRIFANTCRCCPRPFPPTFNIFNVVKHLYNRVPASPFNSVTAWKHTWTVKKVEDFEWQRFLLQAVFTLFHAGKKYFSDRTYPQHSEHSRSVTLSFSDSTDETSSTQLTFPCSVSKSIWHKVVLLMQVIRLLVYCWRIFFLPCMMIECI